MIHVPPVSLNNVLVGAKVTFRCISQGFPPPPIEWTVSSTNLTIVS